MFLKRFPYFLALLLLFAACENKLEDVRSFREQPPGREEGRNIESYLSQGGKVKAKLTAPLMWRYQLDTPRVEFPKSLHVDFYDDTTGIESKLDALYGDYKENLNLVFLKDSVRIVTRKGDSLWCKEMFWNQNTGMFYTDKPTRVRNANDAQYVIATEGFRSNQSFTDLTFFKMVRGSYINLPDSTYY